MKRDIILIGPGSDPSQACVKEIEAATRQPFRIIFESGDIGRVKAVNKGIERSDADFVCVLCAGSTLTPGWLDELTSVAQKSERAGLVCPSDGFAGGAVHLIMNKGRSIEVNCVRHDCYLITRALIRRIGGLDLEFSPEYFEACDYSLRAVKSGFICLKALGSRVGGDKAAADQERKKTDDLYRRNKALFFQRWGTSLRILIAGTRPWDPAVLSRTCLDLLRDGHEVVFLNDGPATRIRHESLHEARLPGFLCGWKAIRVLKERRFDLVVCSEGLKKSICQAKGCEDYRFFTTSTRDNSFVLLKTVNNLKHQKRPDR
ncbi:MAG: glycosyltransferase family 2 protein [Deltaproteobacteria bacterium]